MAKKRLMSMLLCMCMMILLLPTVALASWSSPDIRLGADLLEYDSKVYFGSYAQGGTSYDVPWHILDKGSRNAFVLSEYLLGEQKYYDSGFNGYYGGSLFQTAMNTIYDGFSPAERGACADTTLTGSSICSGQSDLADQKLFPLSYDEAAAIGWHHTMLPAKLITNKYGHAMSWWLRSSVGFDDAYCVLPDGDVDSDGNEIVWPLGVRPAFNLDLSKAIITSAATGGKSSTGMDSGLVAVTVLHDEPDFKLTLLDSDRSDFSAEIADLDFDRSSGAINTITVSYSGAQTGTNEYISAVIVDGGGRITHYGRVKALSASTDTSGNVTVNIPSGAIDLLSSENTLRIFNEQYNGEYKTDYASKLLTMRLWSSNASLDFGTVTADYAIAPDAQSFNLNNISNQNVTVSLPRSSNFNISANKGGIAQGDSIVVDNNTVSFTVQPKTGLAAGNYNETITVSGVPGTDSASASVAVSFTVNTAPTYIISATPERISFESKTVGYSTAPVAQTITIENTGNQSVTLTQPTATNYDIGALSTTTLPANGDTLTFTVQPKTGLTAGTYNETITVFGSNGASDATVLSFTVLKIFKASGGNKNPQTGVDFEDVTGKDWFYNSVVNAVQNGWFAGASDTTFSPYLSTTRSMIVTVLWRIEQTPDFLATTIFEDVPQGQWYYDGVTWAQKNDIVKGYTNKNFGPNDNITREQIASIFYRYAQFKGYDVTKLSALTEFTDADAISDYARSPMSWAVATNLISGKGNGILDPRAEVTRAEVVTILTRFDKILSKK